MLPAAQQLSRLHPQRYSRESWKPFEFPDANRGNRAGIGNLIIVLIIVGLMTFRVDIPYSVFKYIALILIFSLWSVIWGIHKYTKKAVDLEVSEIATDIVYLSDQIYNLRSENEGLRSRLDRIEAISTKPNE